jgi:hypothetical protein
MCSKIKSDFHMTQFMTQSKSKTKDLRINVSPLFLTLSSVARSGFEPGTSGL